MRSFCARSSISISGNNLRPFAFCIRSNPLRYLKGVELSTVATDDGLQIFSTTEDDVSHAAEQRSSQTAKEVRVETPANVVSKPKCQSNIARVAHPHAFQIPSPRVTTHGTNTVPFDFVEDVESSVSTDNWSFKRYLFESAVNEPAVDCKRVVDIEEHRKDENLWLDLLRFRWRHEGYAGCWKVYQGMRSRRVIPPLDSPKAARFWNPFIEAALHMGHMEELWKFAKSLHHRSLSFHDRFYGFLVGSCLAKGIKVESCEKKNRVGAMLSATAWYEAAYKWHVELNQFTFPAGGTLQPLIPIAVKRACALETFKKIYLESKKRDMYHDIISHLCDLGMHETARSWHRVLVTNDDMPPKKVPLKYAWLINDANDNSLIKREDFLVQERLRPNNRPYVDKIFTTFSPATSVVPKEDFASAQERAQPRHGSSVDELCARAFATPGFAPNFVIQCLHMFGVHSVGPLAIQALAQQCKRLVEEFGPEDNDKLSAFADEVALQLDNLRSSGIRMIGCEFNRIIQQLASTRNGRLLSNIITSDRHPEVYEDRILLKRIFDSYFRSNNTSQARDLLEILTVDYEDTSAASWNLLLGTFIAISNPNQLSRVQLTVEAMRERDMYPSKDAMKLAHLKLLNVREPSKAPDTSAGATSAASRLNLVTYIWMRSLGSKDALIEPELWTEIQRRYGMLKMLDELERLVFWLAQKYSSTPILTPLTPSALAGQISARNSGSSSIPTHMDRLFPPRRQMAIIEWYFKTLAEPEALSDDSSTNTLDDSFLKHVEKWARGVAMLQWLKSYGLTVDTNYVRRVCLRRLDYLFGGGTSKRRVNQVAKLRNTRTIRYMIAYLEGLWTSSGESLLQIPLPLLKRDNPKMERYLRMKVALENNKWMEERKAQRDKP